MRVEPEPTSTGSRKRLLRIGLAALLTAGPGLLAAWLIITRVLPPRTFRDDIPRPPPRVDRPPENPPRTYPEVIAGIERQRATLASKLQAVSRDKNRAIVASARRALAHAVRTIIPFWYGTKWDFNGTSQTPGEGAIACGYFVSTVLRDAGLKVERVSLARQASEKIIKTLVGEAYIRRFSNTSVRRFVESIRKDGDGIYVVGLDYHVGLAVCDGGQVSFVHATRLGPGRVISEPASDSRAIADSRYRVYGHITADDGLVRKWLAGAPVPTQ